MIEKGGRVVLGLVPPQKVNLCWPVARCKCLLPHEDFQLPPSLNSTLSLLLCSVPLTEPLPRLCI